MRRLGLLLFILIIAYFIFIIRQDIIDNLELKREERRTLRHIQQEEILTGELQTRLNDLKSEQYIEKLARTRLGLIKKGETAYKVIK
jgi:cell division protein FtsB